MGKECRKGNHVIGCGFNGHKTLHAYIEDGRDHPECLFKYCPECGVKLGAIDDMADKYFENNEDEFSIYDEPDRRCPYCGQESCDCDML